MDAPATKSVSPTWLRFRDAFRRHPTAIFGGVVLLVTILVAIFAPWLASADPQATVPGVVYQSVFKESPTGVETQSVDWKKANADVAQFPRGHVDILKWEEAQIKAKSLVKPMARPGEIPPAPTTPVPPATVHKH